MIGRRLAVLFALCLLGGYVWYSQMQSTPSATPVSGTVVLPEAPANPIMFNTSKSGAVHMKPGVAGMIEKKTMIRSFIVDPESRKNPLE